MKREKWMEKAIGLSVGNVQNGGGPFGAVIVKDDSIVGQGVNQVTRQNDPTAHAEVNAIRDAAKSLGTYDLSDCEMYTSCEPCPMCLGAIYWARLKAVYYGNTQSDAAGIGFDDQFIYEELNKPAGCRAIPMQQLLRDDAIEAFRLWDKKKDKTEY